MVGNFNFNSKFTFQERNYVVVGDDVGRNEIECWCEQDNDYHWFKVTDPKNNMIALIV